MMPNQVAVMAAARPLIGNSGAVIAGMLAAVQFGILGYATICHADHHVLIGLIAIAAVGFIIRAMLVPGGGDRSASAAGLTLAFGIWIGTEMQVTAGLCLGMMALGWAVEGEAWAARNRQLAAALLAGLVAAVLIERGPGAFDVQYDRISIIHVSMAALLYAFWAAVEAFGRRLGTIGSRLAAVITGDVVIVAVMSAFFPKVLISPLKDADPVLLAIFDGVAEYAPMADVAHFLVYAGAVLIALLWALWRAKEDWPSTHRHYKAWAWLLMAAALAVTTAFAVNWIRWSLYVGLFSTVALADVMVRADGALTRRPMFPLRPVIKAGAKTMVLLAIAIGPFAAGMVWMVASAKPVVGSAPTTATIIAEDPRPCPVQAMAVALIGHGRIAKTITDNPIATLQGGSDDMGDMVAPGSQQ